MRRLALLLGVVGAILGGYASYAVLESVMEQRKSHSRFEQLATSDVVQQERKNLRAQPSDWQTVPDDNSAKVAQKTYLDPKTGEPILVDPKTGERFYIDPKTGERIDLSAGLVPKKSGQIDYDAIAKKYGGEPAQKPEHGPWEKYAQPANSSHITEWDAQGNPISSQLNQSDIETIHWTKDLQVGSIETDNGQTLYPTPAPEWRMFLLIAIFPVLGFFIPWGVVRAIVWVGAGFAEPGR